MHSAVRLTSVSRRWQLSAPRAPPDVDGLVHELDYVGINVFLSTFYELGHDRLPAEIKFPIIVAWMFLCRTGSSFGSLSHINRFRMARILKDATGSLGQGACALPECVSCCSPERWTFAG